MKKQMTTMGIENCSQLSKWRTSKVKNCLDKHGVEWYTQTQEFKDKTREKSLEKFGVEHFTKCKSVQEKKVDTCMKKYGKTCVSQVEEFKIIKENTMLRHFGVKHLLQLTGELEKRQRSRYKWSDYVFPSGRTTRIQGYENFALDHLLLSHHEDDIVTDNTEIEKYIGKVIYEYGGGIHRYFPDIYIRSTDIVVEVKSKWTIESQIDINRVKASRVMELGHGFEFLVMDREHVISNGILDI